jgi:cell division protein FtsL
LIFRYQEIALQRPASHFPLQEIRTNMLKRFNTGIQKKYFIFAILICLPLVILEIWSVNRLATLGSQINSLESTAAALRLENQVLDDQIAKRSSISRIESEAQLLGFQKVKTISSVKPDGLALK